MRLALLDFFIERDARRRTGLLGHAGQLVLPLRLLDLPFLAQADGVELGLRLRLDDVRRHQRDHAAHHIAQRRFAEAEFPVTILRWRGLGLLAGCCRCRHGLAFMFGSRRGSHGT